MILHCYGLFFILKEKSNQLVAYAINCAFHNMTMMYKRDQQHNSNIVFTLLVFLEEIIT